MDKLEAIQKFALKLVSYRWDETHSMKSYSGKSTFPSWVREDYILR